MILNALENLTFGTDLLLEEFFSLKRRENKDQFRLKDGRKVRVRTIGNGDVEGILALYCGLSAASKRTRFCGELKNVADEFYQNLAKATVNHCESNGYGLVVFDCESNDLIAVCQLVHNGAKSGEFALTIADKWQGVGLGKVLMKRIVQQAKNSRISILEAVVSHENTAMKLLLMRSGYHLSKSHYPNCAQYKLFLS